MLLWYVIVICVAVALLVTIYILQAKAVGLPYEVVDKLVTTPIDLTNPNSRYLAEGRNALISQTESAENGIYRWDSSAQRLALEVKFNGPIQLKLSANDSYIMVIGSNHVYESLATVTLAEVPVILNTPGYQVYSLTVTGTGTFQNGANVTATVNGEDFAAQAALVSENPANLNAITTQQVTQLSNIGTNTISNAQWGYVSGMAQNLAVETNVSFQEVKVSYGLSPNPVSITLYTSSGSAAFPTGTKGVVVDLQAAGGAGGSDGATDDTCGGGGSGSYATFFLTAAQISGQTGVDFTIAGAANQSNGANTTVSWQGGALLATTFGGGRGFSGDSDAEAGNAGILAVLEPGIEGLVFTGQYGQAGYDRTNTDYINVQSGQGANAVYGAGGGSGMWTGEGPGPIAGEFGGGGSGGVDDRNETTGANGGAGFVRVWIYE